MPRSSRRSAPARPATRPMMSCPAPAPKQTMQPATVPQRAAPAPVAPSAGPGLFGQMAATAGGVAIGSAVGHAVGHAFTGGSGGAAQRYEEQPQQVSQAQEQQGYMQPQAYQQQQYESKGQNQMCKFELDEFIKCAQTNDYSLCEGFNNALKECRVRYGM